MKKILISIVFLSLGYSLLFSQFPMSDTDPVTWSFSKVEKEQGIYELKFIAEIEKVWHIYAMELENDGPIPTSVNFDDVDGIEWLGDLQELSKPKIKFDEGFRFDVGAYYGKAEFSRMVKVSSEDELVVSGYVEYQSCNDETCLPPFQKDFSFRLSGVSVAEQKPVNNEVINESDIILIEENAVSPEEPVEMDKTTGIVEESGKISETASFETASDNAEAEDTADSSSMLGFILLTLGLGFLAILTPCVYPMIPMTISFFMRGEQKRSVSIIKGIVFGLSMILVYTSLGVLVALTGMDANFGNVISTHWIPNLLFFILFALFGASFLGMFEIVLPSGFVNRVDRQGDRGGLIGPFFMGITTVLVSFSCTGPIVGSLLAEAAGGEAIKPILGMFFFSLAFALPFTFLAIFPSMLKNLPKSGGWMNTVKVLLGFAMLAFGMKFLSSVDQSYHLGIFTREIYLAIWFVLAVILGFYLLGKIKFSHDSDLPYVPVPRLMLAIASFVFAIYLFTGILGNNLSSISSMIPPMTSQSFIPGGKIVQESISDDQSATYAGPGKYDDILHLPHGILGYFDFEEGMQVAREKNKPVFLDFTGHSCSNCKQMENNVWNDPDVLQRLKQEYVVISLYTDDRTDLPEDEWITTPEGKVLKKLGQVNSYIEQSRFNTIATPWYVLLDPDGNELAEPVGKVMDVEKYVNFLDKGIENFKK